VAPDVEKWFGKDTFQGSPHIVAQWADAHNSLAQAWVAADPKNGPYVDAWAKSHPAVVAQWIKDNPATPQPKAADLAVVFFKDFSNANPGRFPSAVTKTGADGKPQTTLEPVKEGSDIQSIFFDMWRQDHPDADSRRSQATWSPPPLPDWIRISRCRTLSSNSTGLPPNGQPT